jgi:DNA-binding transcriptional LysR family regulator
MFPTSSLVAFAQDFAREHPAVALLVQTDLLSGVTAHVREKRSTWGVALEDADFTDLEYRPIADVSLVPVAARSHPLARRPAPLDAPSLAGSVQIVLGERSADRLADDRGVFAGRVWRVVDLATKHAFIAGGLGWGNMPEHVVRDDLRAGTLVELRLDPWGGERLRRSLVLVWRKGTSMGPVAKWAEERLTHLCRTAVAASSGKVI